MLFISRSGTTMVPRRITTCKKVCIGFFESQPADMVLLLILDGLTRHTASFEAHPLSGNLAAALLLVPRGAYTYVTRSPGSTVGSQGQYVVLRGAVHVSSSHHVVVKGLAAHLVVGLRESVM